MTVSTEADPWRGAGRGPKGETARQAICDAVIACLDTHGYGETTISRVVEAAGISRGALTHHFPTKEDLIVETTDRLLHRTTRVRPPSERTGEATAPPGADQGFESDFVWLWERLVNTPEGRALIEILTAARTDDALRRKIGHRLRFWNEAMNDRMAEVYESVDGSPEDVRILWTICRVFLRGLIVQGMFGGEKEERGRLATRFAEIMAPHLNRRS